MKYIIPDEAISERRMPYAIGARVLRALAQGDKPLSAIVKAVDAGRESVRDRCSRLVKADAIEAFDRVAYYLDDHPNIVAVWEPIYRLKHGMDSIPDWVFEPTKKTSYNDGQGRRLEQLGERIPSRAPEPSRERYERYRRRKAAGLVTPRTRKGEGGLPASPTVGDAGHSGKQGPAPSHQGGQGSEVA